MRNRYKVIFRYFPVEFFQQDWQCEGGVREQCLIDRPCGRGEAGEGRERLVSCLSRWLVA
eukprot:747627-Hanusia_phi.AAC.5